MSQKDVATALSWHPSKLLRIENGTVGVTPVDLRALLEHYGVRDRRKVDELVKLALGSRKLETTQYRDVLSQEVITFLNYRSAAIRVRQFEPLIIPGLLQTEEYAEEVITAYSSSGDSKEKIEQKVQVRMELQALLERENPPTFYFIIDEAVVRRAVGGFGVMRNQLEKLKKAAELPHVHIQVVPFALGAHAGIRGSFQILEFGEGEDYVLYLENARGDVTSRDMPADTERYLTTFWDLEAQATKPHQFVRFIDGVIKDFHVDQQAAGQEVAEVVTPD